jgi:glycogen synthase
MAINEALELFKDPPAWRQVQRRAMATNFGWEAPAQAYLDLYATIPVKGV